MVLTISEALVLAFTAGVGFAVPIDSVKVRESLPCFVRCCLAPIRLLQCGWCKWLVANTIHCLLTPRGLHVQGIVEQILKYGRVVSGELAVMSDTQHAT